MASNKVWFQDLQSGQTSISNLLLTHFNKIGLTLSQLGLYLVIKQTNDMVVPLPDIKRLSDQVGISENQLFDEFHQMIQSNLMKITKIQVDSQSIDAYSFEPMYQKLADYLEQLVEIEVVEDLNGDATAIDKQQVQESDRQMIFEKIQVEFGRTISPFETELISQWVDIDKYPTELIIAALKEAVLNQVYNLKYMDKILISWHQKNYQTVAQVENARNKQDRNSYSNDSIADYNGPNIPIINLTDSTDK